MKTLFAPIVLLCSPALLLAAELSVAVSQVDATGVGKLLGTVRITESAYGLVFTPSLADLPPGIHGFHVHENPSCAPMSRDGTPVAALAAGGHFDPLKTNRHGEPWGEGHRGDLPGLVVLSDGKANYPVLAPRLQLDDVKNRSLMIHVGGDNHTDHPAPLGGGGARLACGVISAS
ncbi:MAG: superoxide dismutase [Cu-Zn] SodC [Burkholderiaceae bacterium]